MDTLVWLKKDIRVFDHQALFEGSHKGNIACLYIYEPLWFCSYEFDISHLNFLNECLIELSIELNKFNIPLITRIGNASTVFTNLYHEIKFDEILSHEETGNNWTYRRDTEVANTLKTLGVKWTEYRQFSVIRGLKKRIKWQEKRSEFLDKIAFPLPKSQASNNPFNKIFSEGIVSKEKLSLSGQDKQLRQKGGISNANKELQTFINNRHKKYLQSISKPFDSQIYSSRLSPYITWGCISIRDINRAINRIKDSSNNYNKRSINAFSSRLSWHCHFIQKLESSPEIEFSNTNSGFNGMREYDFNEEYFQAWCEGMTGFPIIDACMRSLKKTGWINFRMRAMLMSFSSYQLWLHWEKPAKFLAKHFLDFEAGIHFSQCQMQSGVTGINTIRIYSPFKQTHDNDPDGKFIHTHCPELSNIPAEYLSEPTKLPPLLQLSIGFKAGKTYPNPIINHEKAYRHAKETVHNWKKRPETKQKANEILSMLSIK